ncbi:AI-2E family transporter [Desulfobacterota bacterium M19]
MAKKNLSPLVVKYFLLLFFITILMAGRLLWPLASTLILSLLLVNLFRPVYNFLHRYMSASLASLLTCSLIVILVFVPLFFFVNALSREAAAYLQYIQEMHLGVKVKDFLQHSAMLDRLQSRFHSLGITFNPDTLSQELNNYARIMGMFLYGKASAWAANIVNFVIDFALMVLISFFLLIDYERLVDFVKRLSPLPDEQEEQLIDKFQGISQAIILGNGICGILQGLAGGILFTYLGINAPILWGGIMAVMAFLPIVGIGIILVPTAALFFVKGHLGLAIFIIIFYVITSISIDSLLKPKLVGRQMKMHTLLVFLSLIGGLSVFGVLGIIYGPLIITAFLTMADIYTKNYDSFVKGTGRDD